VHHDFERLSSGNTIVITQIEELWPEINANTIYNDYIHEADATGTLVWSWNMAGHWAQLPFSASERAYLASFPGNAPHAIFHTNSLATLPPNQWEATDPRFTQGHLLVSLRETNKIFIIDRTTGGVTWSWGGAIGQHHARMIPAGLPGAGHILLFDNGGSSGAPPVSRTYSRILEIDPTTKRIVWSYEDRTRFYTNVMGGAQRLAGGGTLITESISGVTFEIDAGGKTVWTHSRVTAEPLYRAYRVDLGWLTGPVSFPW
jgi:hypothetical protein